jgi:hypothetical protein
MMSPTIKMPVITAFFAVFDILGLGLFFWVSGFAFGKG